MREEGVGLRKLDIAYEDTVLVQKFLCPTVLITPPQSFIPTSTSHNNVHTMCTALQNMPKYVQTSKYDCAKA
jgi:hypothetical protein